MTASLRPAALYQEEMEILLAFGVVPVGPYLAERALDIQIVGTGFEPNREQIASREPDLNYRPDSGNRRHVRRPAGHRVDRRGRRSGDVEGKTLLIGSAWSGCWDRFRDDRQ